ncbi:MAG TPA: N-acyl homoserine lactonase family protein, partial [Bradyrhizobium sp.]|nr:N-acyl homoserine lactonase family protein [Bradyrhizobium sp.]
MTDWSIWTFQFAEGRLPLDFVRGTPVASNQGTTPVPMIFSLLQSSDGERIVVDTGFASGASMTGPGFKDFVRSDEILARHGIAADTIDTLVLTHLHFDHAGNLDAFPNARIFVQLYEYESWKKVLGRYGAGGITKDRWVFSSLDENNFRALDRAIAQGRVIFLDGDHQLCDGITCRLARDTHSFGIQWLEVQTSGGPFALAGDVCYSYFCAERMWPPGYLQGNPWNMIEEIERIRNVAGDDLARLLPGH